MALRMNDLLVSMCDLVSPSDRSARREPTNTKMAILGNTMKVARKNCHRATDWMDWVPRQSRSAKPRSPLQGTYSKESVRVHPWRKRGRSDEEDERKPLRSLRKKEGAIRHMRMTHNKV